MCGIAGLIPWKPGGTPPPLARLERAADAMANRGPDARYVGRYGGCALAATRLAIVDRTRASDPPIVDPTGRVVLLYNGELFDADVLRTTLQKRGHTFRSRGDGEVVLAAYLEYGIRFLREIDGMFALCIVDLRGSTGDKNGAPRVLLARDRFGEKPLLFARAPAGIAFASTSAAIRKLVSPCEPDPEALAAVIRHGFIPGGPSPIRGVFRLRPGTALVVGDGDAAVYPFAERRIFEPQQGAAQIHQFWELFTQATRRRARSETGVGLFLSGGLDSTAIARALADLQIPFSTYTAGFRGHSDERELAKETAGRLNVPWNLVELGPELLEEWEPLTREVGEPLANASILNVYALARRARRDVSVVLTGEGGDELFGGYRRERAYHAIERLQMPDFITKTLSKFPGEAGRVGRALRRSPGIGRYQELRDQVLAAEEMLTTEFRKGDAAADEGVPDGDQTASSSDLYSYLPNDLLFRLDGATMAASVEARAPFLDPDVADFGQVLPTRSRHGLASGKKLLRSALDGRAPDAVVRGRKRGFGAPLAQWFAETGFAEKILLDTKACAPPLHRRRITQMLKEQHDRKADHSVLLARAIAVELYRKTLSES